MRRLVVTETARLALVIGVLVVVGLGIERGTTPADGASGEALVAEPRALGPPVLPDRVAPPDGGPHVTIEEAHRPYLRSISTAPVRPRVPSSGGATHDAGAVPVGEVALHRPVLRLDGATADDLDVVRADPEVSHAAAVELGVLELQDDTRLQALLAEPEAFRPMAPRVTARAPAPWSALERGEALLSPHVAGRLHVHAGDGLDVGWGTAVVVGGTASNGAPPLADVLIAPTDEVELSERVSAILVAVAEDADVAALAERLAQATGAAAVALPDAEPATASLVGDDAATVAAFAPFTFRRGAGGRIAVDPAWEAEYIVTTDVPILGEVRCHRLLIPQLTAALQHLVDEGLAPLLDPGDYGGCYVPRHIDWNHDASLSMHAWGVALDVNVATNGLGAVPQIDPRVVEAFTSRGFTWGGDWKRPDGMHFELHRLLTPEELSGG